MKKKKTAGNCVTMMMGTFTILLMECGCGTFAFFPKHELSELSELASGASYGLKTFFPDHLDIDDFDHVHREQSKAIKELFRHALDDLWERVVGERCTPLNHGQNRHPLEKLPHAM